MSHNIMQNFILYFPSISILVFCFPAYIIVIVPNVVSIFAAQPNEFLVQGVEQARVHSLEEVKLSQVGQSCSKVAPYKLREYV